MTTSPSLLRPSSERTLLTLALSLVLASLLCAPAWAADEAPAAPVAANWTVFLSSGSSIAATEVHHDKNQGRYTLKLERGGYIHLSTSAVKRVSRDAEDRVEKTAAVVATSTGSARQGAVPGSIDTSGIRPPAVRSATASVSPDGAALKDRAADRLRRSGTGFSTEGSQSRPNARGAEMTPQRGMMDRMIRQRNAAPKASRR